MTLFFANLAFDRDESHLRKLFEASGVTVLAVRLLKDIENGTHRGHGFLDIADSDRKAALAIKGKFLGGRPLHVGVSRDKKTKHRKIAA